MLIDLLHLASLNRSFRHPSQSLAATQRTHPKPSLARLLANSWPSSSVISGPCVTSPMPACGHGCAGVVKGVYRLFPNTRWKRQHGSAAHPPSRRELVWITPRSPPSTTCVGLAPLCRRAAVPAHAHARGEEYSPHAASTLSTDEQRRWNDADVDGRLQQADAAGA